MDQQAATLLATLKRTSVAAETKLALLNTLKSDIKHYRVPDNAQGTTFECLRIAITQQTSSSLATAAFSTLVHLVKRLKIQDPEGRAIAAHAPKLFPALHDRLGDQRDGYRQGALQAFVEIWPFCSHEVETAIRDEAIGGHNIRAKEMGMQWVVKMHEDAEMPFKAFVPHLVACLEDADGAVRDAAKSALVELFRPASTPAKNDLKKQLRLHEVRQSIVTQILTQIGANSSAPAQVPEVDLAASTRSLPGFDHIAAFAESINSEDARPPPPEDVPMDPIFVNSRHELEDMLQAMHPHFEGRESEENWILRDKDIGKLRRLTKGNAPSDYHQAFMAGLKALQEGTLKAANSLRTTFSTGGCHLVQELARTLGPAMDSMAEQYIQNFIKMTAQTKQITAQNGNQTVDTIFHYVSYNLRMMQHIWAAAQDKNKAPRTYTAGWLRTILQKQAGSRMHFETSGGLDLAEKTIKRCLEDNDPKVKESMRATYWAYAKTWPDRAEKMMDSLETKIRTALEKDPHNPNAPKQGSQPNFSASVSGRPGGARSSLKERIAADKRAAKLGRPVTAMASISPSRSKSMANLGSVAKPQQQMAPPAMMNPTRVASNVSTSSTSTTRSVESSSSTSTATMKPNSLMSGAARRPVKRPELSRPQTADPYAQRRLLRPETPSNNSPSNSPRQSTSSRPTVASATAARNRVGHVNSPAGSPLKQQPNVKPLGSSRPSSQDRHDVTTEDTSSRPDDFTMVLPGAELPKQPTLDKTMSVDTGIAAVTEDDNFTMIMPNIATTNGERRDRSPLAYRSPARAMSEENSHIPLPSSARSSLHGRSPPIKSASPSSIRSPSSQNARGIRKDAPNENGQVNGTSKQGGSPLKTSSTPQVENEEVRIYEDPFVADAEPDGTQHTPEVRQPDGVLTELPINENQRSESSSALRENGNHQQINGTNSDAAHEDDEILDRTPSPPQSPHSKSETLRARKLLQSGIERIKARTLDTHGFRKVLELTRNNEPLDLFGYTGGSKRYDDLMASFCDFITLPNDRTYPPSKQFSGPAQSQELKRQALGLLKSLLSSQQPVYRKWNHSGCWHAKCLKSALTARTTIEGLGMVVKDIEQLTQECLRSGNREQNIETVAVFLDRQRDSISEAYTNGDSEDPRGSNKAISHATALSIRTLTFTISPSATTSNISTLTSTQTFLLATLSSQNLHSPDAEVRKAAVELATRLYGIWPSASASANATNGENGTKTRGAGAEKGEFWSALDTAGGAERGQLDEGTKNLIVYFIAREEGVRV